jgi:hypothetical protein
VNAFLFSKNVRQHLGIPLLLKVTKVYTGIEKLLLEGSILFHLNDLFVVCSFSFVVGLCRLDNQKQQTKNQKLN